MKENIELGKCTKCNIFLPLSIEFFHADSSRKNRGFMYICRNCEINRSICKAYKQSDRLKNRENNINIEDVNALINKTCIYCNFPATGFDRIDNSLGHTLNNCVPCCKQCNLTRLSNYSHEEMFILGKAIKEIKLNRVLFHK